MRNCWTSVLLCGVVWGASSASEAAEQPLSYAADNACYCNPSATTPLLQKIVATPIGGQSVAQVCERVGEGPKLTGSAGNYNYPVFDDLQCGHGPGPAGFVGSIDSSGKGPKWDLAKAYAKKSGSASTASSGAATSEGSNRSSSVASGTQYAGVSRRLKPRYTNAQQAVNNATTDTSKTQAVAAETNAAETNAVVRSKPAAVQPQREVTATAVTTTEPAKRVVEPVKPAAKPAVVVKREVVQPTPRPVVIIKEEVISPAPEKPASVATAEVEAVEAQPEQSLPKRPLRIPRAPIVSATPVEEETKEPAGSTLADAEPAATILTTPEQSSGIAPVGSAFQLPSGVRASSTEFDYISVMPMGYDYGGAGVQVALSTAGVTDTRLFIRAGVAETYQEGLIGGSFVFTPERATRLAFILTGGVEVGRFKIEGQGIETNDSDSGLFLRGKSRYVLSNRIELQAGLGYSSFFDGDPHVFGAALFHLTKQMDLTGEFEVGDNDSLGLGIRYYY